MEIEKKREYKSKVSTILEELKQSNINLGNYRKYIDKLKSTEEIILAMIENTLTEYNDMDARYSDMISKTSFKDGLEGNIVPKEVFDLLLSIIKNAKERFSWQSLQLELNFVMREKLAEIMGDTQAYEIKKDSLQEMREDSKRIIEMSLSMQKQNNDLVQSSINGRIQYLEDKMTNFMERAIGRINDERKQMYEIMRVMIKAFKESHPSEIEPRILEPVKVTKQEIEKEIEPDISESKKRFIEFETKRLENDKLRKEIEEQREKAFREKAENRQLEKPVVPREVNISLDDLDDDDDLDMDEELKDLDNKAQEW